MVNGTNYITIATDASLSDNNQLATWACYIRGPKGTIKHSGRLKEYPAKGNSHYAETLALANALVIVDNNMDVAACKVVIYNEVSHVLTPTRTKNGTIRLKDRERSKIISDVMLPILNKAVSYELRDVKAHSSAYKKEGAPKKFFMNRWCDLSSRRLLRELARRERVSTSGSVNKV